MALIFVTGISAAGKSTVREELTRRGFQAYDTDEDEIAQWHNRATGEITPATAVERRTPEFIAQNEWKVDPERVRELAGEANDRIVFLCGSIGNDDEVWPSFDAVFLLSIDEPTMRHRLATRTAHDFGKEPHELDLLHAWREVMSEHYLRLGAVEIDATRPSSTVVDDILRLGGLPG